MKYIFGLLIITILFSCKAKSTITGSNADKTMEINNIIEKHFDAYLQYNTLYIKGTAKYKDEKQTQSVTTEIKIKKDEKILVSVRFLGITMAKALITPTNVQYYEKINGTYFEGDYESLSKWLGTNLDYFKVQNLLLGKPIEDLKLATYNMEVVDKLYKLNNINETDIKKSFFIEPENYLLRKQEIAQPLLERMLLIQYVDYQKKEERFVPLSFTMEANDKEKKNSIEIQYKNITVNEDLGFPYSVPEGYERVFIHNEKN